MWIIGISHHTTPVELREQFALTADEPRQALRALGDKAASSVILSTCNRTEIYSAGSQIEPQAAFDLLAHIRGVSPAILKPYHYVYRNHEAARHLFRVTSGLDSQIIGESQIAGQVREAYALACDVSPLGPIVNGLFQRALRVGRRVRRETAITSYAASSMSSVAIDIAQRMFPDMQRRTVLVVGAGSVGKLAADAIRRHGVGQLWVTSRTEAHGKQLAKALAAQALPWSSLPLALSDADIVLSGTNAPSPILTREMVASAVLDRARPRLLIDLAVPRDIEPAVAELPGVTLLDIDDIQLDYDENEWPPSNVIAEVESIIEDELTNFRTWQKQRAQGSLVAALRQSAEAIRQREVEHTLGHLPDLTTEELARVEALSRALVKQLLHVPTTRLKNVSPDSDLTKAAERLFGLPESRE